MKTFIALAFLLSMSSSYASTFVAKCTNDADLSVVVSQVASGTSGTFKADVSMESVGDSRPTFHFNNLKLAPREPRRLGAPFTYKGKDFELTIQFDASAAPAYLTVPSLGLHAEQLHCR